MTRARVAVIQFPGVNCETESMRALTRVALSESPPRAKKSSSSPTRARPNTSANASAMIFSVWFCGARNALAAKTGAGNAFRSTLPDEVNGNFSSATMCAGTM